MNAHVVSAAEWDAAREKLLVKEKELTRARDALAAERRRMPWQAVEKAYSFDGPKGKVSLLDLFEGRHQLIVGSRPGLQSRPPQRARHNAGVRLACTAGRHRAAEGTDGLGAHPLVHH